MKSNLPFRIVYWFVVLCCLVAYWVPTAEGSDDTFHKCVADWECVKCFANYRSSDRVGFPAKAEPEIERFLKSGKTCKEYIGPMQVPATAYPPEQKDPYFGRPVKP